MAYSVGIENSEVSWEYTKEGFFYFILILYAIITTIPFIWSLLTSFKTLPESARATPTLLPHTWTLDAWNGSNGVLTAGSFPRWFVNSIVVAILVTVGNLFF